MINLGQIAQRGVPGQQIQNRDYYPFRGGLNLVDPFLSITPGQLLATMNYEVFYRGGYRRVAGYERFDGRPQPHKATYRTIRVTSWIGDAPVVGGLVTWSLGQGVVIYMVDGVHPVVGDYVGEDPVVGGFIVNGDEDGTEFATITDILIEDTLEDEQNALALAAAQEQRRAVIEGVPGTGPVRGIAFYNDALYAFRDNLAETECVMWRSSASGYVQVSYNPIVRFVDGRSEIFEGDVITGATSGATATVARLRRKLGFWSNGSANGYLVLKNLTGTFSDGEILTVGAVEVANASGSNFLPTLPAGGEFDFRVYTFSNQQTKPRLYGCSGTTWAWEYDAVEGVFAPIETGMDPDTPSHLACHNRMLFLSFRGGSVQNSNPNNPMAWTLAGGADEQLAGGEITGFIEEVNDALLIYKEDSISVLYGQTSPEFNLVTLNREMGGIPRTMKRIGTTIHLDQRGFTSVAASDVYGNFSPSNLSQLIQPVLNTRMGDIFGSQISRRMNLYRLFMKDGSAFSLGFHGNDPAGFTMIDYGRPITALWSSQTEGNQERLFFASDNGVVYEQEVGTSFDGEPIEAFALMVFYHSGSPEQVKRYRKAVLEMSGFQASIRGSIDVNYGGTGETGAVPQEIGVSAGGNFWDVGVWSEFKWSEGVGADPSFYIEDSGFNIGLHLYHNSAVEQPHILNGINITWSPRRLKREF